MAAINVLPPALASQIAAGEVVERPASAAKELIENALDAAASRCDVQCNGGGVSHLSVSDDGIGMSERDAAKSVERHATSKLTQVADLARIASFGFRGEALPSIASVSRFTLRTRPRDCEHGCCVQIDGGASPVIRREGMPVGTTVILKDLFFNVPARRKFLRSTGTEAAHVTSVLEGAALSRPEVTFTLERDGRKLRELLRTKTRRERVLQLLEEEKLAEIRGERGPLRLEAQLAPPERARSGTVGLWLLVNGRVVRDRMIAATVAQAYGAAIAMGNYPRGVVYLDLPPELVDVNVHPQKTEVRFVDPRALSDAIYAIVSRALSEAFALPAANRAARYDVSRGRVAPPGNLLPIEQPTIHARPRGPMAPNPPDPWTLGLAHREPDRIAPAPPAKSEPSPSANQGSSLAPAPPAKSEPSPSANQGSSLAPAPPAKSEPSPSANQGSSLAPAPSAKSEPSPSANQGSSLAPAPPAKSEPSPSANQGSSQATAGADGENDDIDEPAPDTMLTPLLQPRSRKDANPVDVEGDNQERHSQQNSEHVSPRLRFLAQVRLAYLICEAADGLYIVDQHAAAECATYSKLQKQYRARSIISQILLFPVMIELLPKELELVEAELETFRSLGLDTQIRGRDRISVHSTPRLLQRASPEVLIRLVLGELRRQDDGDRAASIERALAAMACPGSLRAGEALTTQQAQSLLGSLDVTAPAAPCPHGRPIVSVTRFDELERQAGRRA